MRVSLVLHRQSDHHAGALSRSAMRFNGSAIGFDQRLGNGQTQTVPARITGTRSVSAVKAFEDEWQLRSRDARSVVGDLDTAMRSVGVDAYLHRFSLRTEADGVLQQVRPNQFQVVGIGWQA